MKTRLLLLTLLLSAFSSFAQRTGITVTDDANFPDALTYTENPGGVISNITATTQARVDALFPAPPSFS